MKNISHIILLGLMMILNQGCSEVLFSKDSEPDVVVGPSEVTSYQWVEGGFTGLCSKACGGGTQTQTVECKRTSDNVTVEDSKCNLSLRPEPTRVCNTDACPSDIYAWNRGPFGECSLSCGGGVKTRIIECQVIATGTPTDEANCSYEAKGETTMACNTEACPVYTYDWNVGTCSKECGGGTRSVTCKRNDGSTVADSECNSVGAKPSTSCNPQACPIPYTYSWEYSAWSTCSADCGAGVSTRTAICRRNDGQAVDAALCTSPKEALTKACQTKICEPTTIPKTKQVYVTPAINAVDVILIIDDSNSMAPDNLKLANKMAGFINELEERNLDYQVCVTATDVKYYQGSPRRWSITDQYVMNKLTPNKTAVFNQTITDIGAGYSSDEQAIKSLNFMINNFKWTGCIRDEATLSVIVISDEDERSVGGNSSLSQKQYVALDPENYPSNLIGNITNTYGSDKAFIWNSIIVKPGDNICYNKQNAEGTPAFYGHLYASLSNQTQGHIGSICDADYTQNLKFIREKIVNKMPSVELECNPVGAINYSFSPNFSTTATIVGNLVKFNPAVPEGTTIQIDYNCAP